MNELAKTYSPENVEDKWYSYWMEHDLFKSVPDEREPYTIVIPPPNVTGILHMGHMLNNTIQDILIRRARMEGKNALWVPGTDHAAIATEAKVVAKLATEGIKKSDLTREEFLKHAWEWKEKYGGTILEQLKKIGASCDWSRTAFTMDDIRSKSVIKVFCELYRKGLIYRGKRMVNWDPKACTALSDIEVVYKEEHSKLYYLRYKIVGEDGYAIVATTRPETIMGDTAMCINPNDPKNQHLRGKKVIVPLVNREIPVIEDDYVDIEFGTGCLKVTPARQRHHKRSRRNVRGNGSLRCPQADSHRPSGSRTHRKNRGLRKQGGLLRTQYRHCYRAATIRPVVLEDGRYIQAGSPRSNGGLHKVRSREVQEHLQHLDG